MSLSSNIQWIKLLFQSDSDAAQHYDLRGDAALLRTHEGTPTMNMGYWRGLDVSREGSLWAATQALFDLVARAADLSPADEAVLDAGCGFGTNAVHCLQHHGPRRVVGINLSQAQLAHCHRLATAAGLGERAAFLRASATAMPFADGTFDKVVSVEAAFHFAPRTDFLREAYRVLRPGGVLALADLVPVPPPGALRRMQLAVLRRSLQIPESNVYGLDTYRENLAAAGFQIEQLASIRDDVLPHYPRWLLRHRGAQLLPLDTAFALTSASFFLYPWEYVLIKVRKPLQGALSVNPSDIVDAAKAA